MSKTSFILPFTLLLALPLFFFLFTHPVLPPKRLLSSSPNTIDDTSLFRQATHSTTISPRGKPKIAFLFLTHTDLHFAPLWQKFFNSSPQKNMQTLYNIYVHAYPDFEDKYQTGSVFKNRFIPAKKTERSSPSLISATRRLLATALLDDPLNSYFALVSETCIPLHSFSYTYKTLFKNKPTESTRSPTRVSYIEVLSDEPQMWDRYIARGESVMEPEVPFTEFRVGSQFFILNRVHSLMVVKDRTLWKKFRLPCINVDTCYPEEHYFPTLLSMKDPTRVSKDTLTRVDWTGSVGGHPRTYEPSELTPEMIKELRGSNTTKVSYLFARKFSPDCLPVLMDMADDVIFRE